MLKKIKNTRYKIDLQLLLDFHVGLSVILLLRSGTMNYKLTIDNMLILFRS